MAFGRRSPPSSTSKKQPKATPAPKAPKPPAKPVKPAPAHYRTLLPTYWARSTSPEVLNSFAARVRSDLSPEEIREEILPMLPAQSMGTTGVQIARLRAALERVSKG
jgi:hypothetical protein